VTLVIFAGYCFGVSPDDLVLKGDNTREFILRKGLHLAVPGGGNEIEHLLVHLFFLIGLDKRVKAYDGALHGGYDVPGENLGQIMEEACEIIVETAFRTGSYLQGEKVGEDGNDEHVAQRPTCGVSC